MLAEPQPTPLDLRFRLFGTPVSVHPFFWLMAVLLGWNLTSISLVGDNGTVALLLWIVSVFVSILLHEFGHIWMGKAFGTDGYIVMHGMGGLAIGSNQLYTPWKRIFVSAGGPAIQLALWGVLYGLLYGGAFASFGVVAAAPDSVQNILFPVRRAVDWQGQGGSPVPFFLLFILLQINLLWPLLNLLPIWPLDGGQITREVFGMASPRNGVEASLWVSLVLCALLALNAFFGDRGGWSIPYAPKGTYMGIFFAIFAVGSWQALQAERSRRTTWMDHREW